MGVDVFSGSSEPLWVTQNQSALEQDTETILWRGD